MILYVPFQFFNRVIFRWTMSTTPWKMARWQATKNTSESQLKLHIRRCNFFVPPDKTVKLRFVTVSKKGAFPGNAAFMAFMSWFLDRGSILDDTSATGPKMPAMFPHTAPKEVTIPAINLRSRHWLIRGMFLALLRGAAFTRGCFLEMSFFVVIWGL